MTFKLNAEGIQQIFAEQPHVHKAFLDNVPHNLTEAAFWDRYFKNEFRMRVSHNAAHTKPVCMLCCLILHKWCPAPPQQ